MGQPVSARIRMYRLNELGDCFLITFTAGTDISRLLIDCGSFRNSKASVDRLKEIVASIKEDLDGDALNVVVGTHQHNDHLSGFIHCEEAFRSIGIEQVWLSWLDDPRDTKAQKIGKDFNNLRLGLAQLRDQYLGLPRHRQASSGSPALRAISTLQDLLSAFGSLGADTPPVLPANATKLLRSIGKQDPKYLRPGKTLDMPGLPQGAVRIHVLGPPRIEGDELLFRPNPRKGESYDLAVAAAAASVPRLLDAMAVHDGPPSREEEQYPFKEGLKLRKGNHGSAALRALRREYENTRLRWRRIDDAWLNSAGSLALFLDDYTNNSSLALAIELVEAGKVLLFPADAQTGNWVSWQSVNWEDPSVTTDDLLSRTAFYKVGHHASHNATLVEAFEKLNRPDLIAFIPVNKKDPNITKANGWKMPARNLFKRLEEKTDHRVLQMDGVNPTTCNPSKKPARASWKGVGISPKVDDLFIEVEIT